MSVDDIRTSEVEQLLSAFAALDTHDERFAFLVDVCTVREIEEMSQRLEVARLLHAGEPYAAIHTATGASTTTVARVSRSLNHGEGGYRTVLDRIAPPGATPSGSAPSVARDARPNSDQ